MDDAKAKWEEDSKITRACADAMGIRPNADLVRSVNYGYALAHMGYDPLHDDAQAMALQKRFGIATNPLHDGRWEASTYADDMGELAIIGADLNHALCELVTHLPAAQQPEGKL